VTPGVVGSPDQNESAGLMESLRKTKERDHMWCRRRRNRIHTDKEGSRQYKTNSIHKIFQTLSEVAHKIRENHFAKRTQDSEARIQHKLTWKSIQDTHNTQDKTRHIEETGNTPVTQSR
jgi:hypothetical protein